MNDKSFTGTGEFKLHYTNIGTPASAVLGPAVHFGDGKITVNTELSTAEITRAKRGLNVSMDERITSVKIAYDMELNILSLAALNIMLFGKEGTSGATNARGGGSATIEAFNFNTGGSGILCDVNKWYPLLDDTDNTKQHRNINTITLTGSQLAYGAAGTSTTLAEGYDYELDKELGLIKFKAAIGDDTISGSVGILEITTASPTFKRAVTPYQRAKWSGIGDLQVYDENGTLIWNHTEFAVDLIPGGNLEFSPQNPTVARIRANVVAPLGNILASELN